MWPICFFVFFDQQQLLKFMEMFKERTCSILYTHQESLIDYSFGGKLFSSAHTMGGGKGRIMKYIYKEVK